MAYLDDIDFNTLSRQSVARTRQGAGVAPLDALDASINLGPRLKGLNLPKVSAATGARSVAPAAPLRFEAPDPMAAAKGPVSTVVNTGAVGLVPNPTDPPKTPGITGMQRAGAIAAGIPIAGQLIAGVGQIIAGNRLKNKKQIGQEALTSEQRDVLATRTNRAASIRMPGQTEGEIQIKANLAQTAAAATSAASSGADALRTINEANTSANSAQRALSEAGARVQMAEQEKLMQEQKQASAIIMQARRARELEASALVEGGMRNIGGAAMTAGMIGANLLVPGLSAAQSGLRAPIR